MPPGLGPRQTPSGIEILIAGHYQSSPWTMPFQPRFLHSPFARLCITFLSFSGPCYSYRIKFRIFKNSSWQAHRDSGYIFKEHYFHCFDSSHALPRNRLLSFSAMSQKVL
ncbi:hypothetical protein PM082_021418 [Marasmius tenuissimus]|nr:hypothetical protein PM082_021418 [Marasmius tenuissimus]